METLFPPAATAADVPPIPGLRYLPEYLSEAEEPALVAAIDRLPWNTEWRRRRQPYGAGYGTRGRAAPIPEWGRLRAAGRAPAAAVGHVPLCGRRGPRGELGAPEFDPHGGVVTRLLPRADVPVHAGRGEPTGGRRVEQQVVDPQPGVPPPRPAR